MKNPKIGVDPEIIEMYNKMRGRTENTIGGDKIIYHPIQKKYNDCPGLCVFKSKYRPEKGLRERWTPQETKKLKSALSLPDILIARALKRPVTSIIYKKHRIRKSLKTYQNV